MFSLKNWYSGKQIVLTLVLVFSITMPLYASVIRSANNMADYNYNRDDIFMTEPSFIVFDSILSGRHNKNHQAAIRGMQVRYDKRYGTHVDIDQRPTAPAPVPEPITLILFGTGLLGVGVLRRRRANNQLK